MDKERFELEKLPIDTEHKEIGGLRPRYASAGYGYGSNYGVDEGKIHVRELWRTIRKRKWMILTLILVITTLVTIEMYRTRNTYQASALIEIGKDSASLGKTGSLFGDDYDPYYMVNIKTKMLSLQSRSLMESVVTSLNLDQNPKFLEAGRKKSFWGGIKSIAARVGLGSPEDNKNLDDEKFDVQSDMTEQEAEEKRREACVTILQATLNVEPIRETKAIRISYTHADPEIAQAVTNSIAENFLNNNFQSKTEKFTRTAKWLDEQTNRLKAQVEKAEQALANYTRERGIFSTDGKDATLTTDKLSRLHEQAMRAETDRMLKQSLYEEVKQGRVQQLPEAFADMVYKSSPKMAELQRQLGELEANAAELGVKFGPDNPQVREVKGRIEAIKEQIAQNSTSLEAKVRNDYERALRDEQMLKNALTQAKGEAIQQNQDAIQFNILKQDVDTAKTLYTEFLGKTSQANAQIAEQYNNLKVIEPAQLPHSAVGPRRMLMIMASFMLSLAVGVGLAFFLEYLDNTIKTVEDVSRYTQLPALSVIPAATGNGIRRLSSKGRKRIATANLENAGGNSQLVALDTRSSAAEAYRVLRTSVLLSAAGHPPKTILVTSGQPGEGKTTTVVNTAISLAQLGASVLLIDCDLRRPTTHKVLGVDHAQGLSTYLSRDVDIDDVIQKLPIANLSLLPCGPIPPNPAELISSDKMKEMLEMLAERYDHILIDSPPLINVTDPVILSTMVDGVMLVVHGGKSTRDIVRRARQELSSVGAKIFGVVLNNVDLRREGYDDYYYYRYYSGYGEEEQKAAKG